MKCFLYIARRERREEKMRGRNALCVAIPSYQYDYLYNGDHNASPSRLLLPSEILVSILLYLFFKPTKACRDFSLVRKTDDPQSSVFILIPNTIFLSGNLLFYIKLFLFILLMCFIPHSLIPTLFMLRFPFLSSPPVSLATFLPSLLYP